MRSPVGLDFILIEFLDFLVYILWLTNITKYCHMRQDTRLSFYSKSKIVQQTYKVENNFVNFTAVLMGG